MLLLLPRVQAKNQDSLPGWTVERPRKPMTPQDFRQYVKESSAPEAAQAKAVLPEGGGLMTLSMEPGSVLDAEIDALARGLKYDPGLMYKFVHDYIRFYPMWGDVKGAAMTLLDRSGDAFDQAALLIALLTKAASAPEAPYTIADIKYVVRQIQLNASQITNWLGIPDSNSVASDLLAAGGIPGWSVGKPDGTIDYVQMDHVWVKATINGVVREFDSSFKTHAIKAGLTDSQLESAMGYTRSAFLTSAQQGATIGSDYVQHLHKGNITGNLNSYSTSLIDCIKTNYPDGDLADIIGGRTIVPAPQSPLPPPLPYQKLALRYECAKGGLRWQDITNLQVQHGGINQSLDTSKIYGHRLLLTFEPYGSSEVTPSLWLDGVFLAQAWRVSIGSDFDFTLTVTHPGHASESRTVTVKAGGKWHIVNGWGDVGTRIIEQHRRILQQNRHDGLADDSKEVLGESFTLTGLTWAAEVCRMQSLVSQISDCTVINQHLIGVMGQYQAPYIDMPLCRGGIVSHTGSSEAERAAFLAVGSQSSAYEHGVIQQLQDYNAVSTVKLLDIANDRTSYSKIFEVTSANWSSVQSQLYGYSQNDKDDVNDCVSQGYTVYLPEYGDLGEEDWKGIGYLATKFGSTSWAATYGISGGYSGGYLSKYGVVYDPSAAYDYSTVDWAATNPLNVRSVEPIDLVTGAYTYDHTDIDIGNGGFPFGLGLGRQYNSIQRLEDGPLGLGWTHGFAITTKVTSDGLQAMGEDSAVDAAANVVGLYVAFDLFRDLSSSGLLKTVVASIGEKWLMDQMIDNVVVVKQGHEAMEFVKLPDGSFNPPPGKALRLIKEPDDTHLLKDPAGNLLHFDASNRVWLWSDPHGNAVYFVYDANGKLASVTSKIGGSIASRSLSFTYNVNDPNHVSTVTDSAGRSISFGYDPNHNLARYTDPNGCATTFNYDTANDGQLLQVFYPNNPTQPYVTNVYDLLGRVMQQTNAAGYTYDYFYAYYRTEEQEPTQTPPSGPAARYSKVYWFDDHGQTVAVEDQLGRTATTEYDGQQRAKRVVSPTGTSVEYTYDLNHNVVEARSKPITGSGLPDIVQTAAYATHDTASGRWLNRMTSQTDAAGHTTAYEYDFSNPAYNAEFGDLRKVTLPQVTDYRGQAVTATQQFTYTAYGQPETVTDANGIVTKFEYYTPAEGGGLKKTIVDFGAGSPYLNLTTQLAYDRAGDVNTVTDAQGHVTQSTYFPSRRLQKTVSPAPFNYETWYEYFADGKLQRVKQQMGADLWQVMDYTYTATGATATVKGPYQLGQSTQENYTQYAYDALDRLWQVTDAEGNVTETRYWPDGRVWKTIDAEGRSVVTHTYNANGTLYSVQDAKGNATVYGYDDFRRPQSTRYADNTHEEISYDDPGRVHQTTTRAGQTTQFTYDALNRIVSRTIAGSTTTYGYDLAGRTVNTTDSVGTLRNTFDRLGRVGTATQTNGAKVCYDYDTLGRHSKLTYPDNSFVTYSYDNLGRLTAIKDPADSNLARYSYDDLSRRKNVQYANGTSSVWTYSNTNRLQQLSNAAVTGAATYAYTYDLVGNRLSMTVNGAAPHVYTYDHTYQLLDANYPAGYFRADTAFTYDPAGNRSQVSSPPTTYLTNNLNQYTLVGSDSFSYDTNGNLTGDGHHSYTYDAESRLTATSGGHSVQYTYDAASRRIRKNVDGRITQYVYDGDQVITEYDGAGTLLRTFVYGPGIDEPICLYAHNLAIGDVTGDAQVNLNDLLTLAPKWLLTSQDSGYDPLHDLNQDGKIDNGDTDVLAAHWLKPAEPVQVFYYHFDGLGSVVALSDAAGHVVETYAYDVYGQSRPTGPATGNPYRFTARSWDPETGLYYYRARYYNPSIGRFLQPDPLGYKDGINWYLYCGNNPIIHVDPYGLVAEPGFWEGMIPMWGSGKSAAYQFGKGHYVRGTVYGAMAVSDVFLVKSIVTGLAKGAVKVAGSHTQNATTKWLLNKGLRESGEHAHHALIADSGAVGKYVPDVIKNQPWNYKMLDPVTHGRLHGSYEGLTEYSALGRWWYGTPTWSKAALGSYGGRLMTEGYEALYPGNTDAGEGARSGGIAMEGYGSVSLHNTGTAENARK